MEERFLSKVDKNSAGGCWNWTGYIGVTGYGRFKIKGINYSPHRIAYELWVGKIPEGLIIRHKCKQNRRCVNPEHLETGTHYDNAQDVKRDGTKANSAGEKNGVAKLNDNSVREIRERYKTGNIIYDDLGKLYNVSGATIYRVIKHKNWKHIN